MKKTKFLSQLSAITDKAEALIKNIPEGMNIVLIDTSDEENDINEVPIATKVGKYGDYDEYAIVSVQKKNGNVILHLEGKSEASGEEVDLGFDDMGSFFVVDSANICDLADQLSEHLTELEIG